MNYVWSNAEDAGQAWQAGDVIRDAEGKTFMASDAGVQNPWTGVRTGADDEPVDALETEQLAYPITLLVRQGKVCHDRELR